MFDTKTTEDRMLDYLQDGKSTERDISLSLHLPARTVRLTLSYLENCGLVEQQGEVQGMIRPLPLFGLTRTKRGVFPSMQQEVRT